MVGKRLVHDGETARLLERKLAKAIRDKNDRVTSDLFVELGEEYRRVGDIRRALERYSSGAQFAEHIDADENAAFAHRAIAEISVHPDVGENKRALEHGRKYLEAANRTKQPHLIQLAYHVLGWLYLQVYLNSTTKHTSLLEKAKRWCEKCLAYLEEKGVEIDCDQRAIRIGRDTACRRARVRQLLSQICDKLGMVQLARCHHNAVMAYASRTCDHDLQYRCLLAKLDFAGEQRLKTAIELVHVAANLNARELLEAQLILAQEKARAKDFEGAKWDLISMLSSKGFTKLEIDEQKSFQQLLVVVYKTIERLKEVNQLGEDQQAKLYEKIADEFYELDLRELSLDFYKLMLRCAKTIREQIAASVSVAVTAKELCRYEEAYEYFMKVEMLEAQLDLSNFKRAETAICLANAASNVNSIPNARIMELFERAESYAVTNTQKIDVYEAMLSFLRKTKAEEVMVRATEEKLIETKRMLENEDKENENTIRDEDADSDAHGSFSDHWDERNDLMIIERCMAEASQRNVEERIRREKDKRINSYGETRLHEAARGDQQQYLKTLLAAGYNVNARDEGGWTPLHEAIGALKLENVRLLLKAGANVNLRSREGTLSAEGQPTDSGGLTPLMEACDRGSTAICDVLLQFGANVALKNTDGWTAVDFLRNAISVGMVDEEDVSEAERLIRVMEDKLREANISISNRPPPKKLETMGEKAAKSSARMRQRSPLEQLSPDERNLREYRRMMCVLGRGSSHQHTAPNEATSAVDQTIHVEKAVGEISDIDEGLDTLLYGEEDGENSLKTTVLAHPSRGDCTDYTPIKQCASFGGSKHQDINYERDDFIEEDILVSRRQMSSRTRKRNSSPTVLRSSASKMARQRIIELPDSGSDEDHFSGSSRAANSVARSGNEDLMLASTTANESTQKLRGYVEKSNASTLMRPSSSSQLHPLHTSVHSSCAASNTSLSQQTSTSSRLLLVRVSFITDTGTRLKTKGIPFQSSSRVGDVRERCISEMRADGEFHSLSLFDGECELDDETPLELITNSSEQIECRVFGWMPPSAAHIYSTKATRVMHNILRALGDTVDGCLRLSEMNIGEDAALIKAMQAFAPRSLSALQVDGNALSAEFIEAIAKMAENISQLSMNCCQLDSKSLRLLLEIGRSYPQLTDLSMSFNDLSSAAIPDNVASLVHVCPTLTSLHLASCNLGLSAMSQLVHAITELHHLEDLDLSQNISVNSAHVGLILNSCSHLSRLNVAATSVTEVNAELNIVSKLHEVNLSLCELCDDAKSLFGWMLQCCDEITYVDLRATNISFVQLDAYCKGKGNKQPVTTLKLAGCGEVESDEGAFVSMMKIVVTTDFGVRFELEEEFKNRVIAALPESFAFCFV